jgi:hypothetical protein
MIRRGMMCLRGWRGSGGGCQRDTLRRGGGDCLDLGDLWISGDEGLFVVVVVQREWWRMRPRLFFFDTLSFLPLHSLE